MNNPYAISGGTPRVIVGPGHSRAGGAPGGRHGIDVAAHYSGGVQSLIDSFDSFMFMVLALVAAISAIRGR